MSDDRSPAHRNIPSVRPRMKHGPFWESKEDRRLREIENAAIEENFKVQVDAVVDHTRREVRKIETRQVIDNVTEVANYARQSVFDNSPNQRDAYLEGLIERVVDAYVEDEATRRRR